MLAGAYLENFTPMSKRLFRFGCIEPDMNPLSYFKGSLRHQFLKGHNTENAKAFIRSQLSCLEKKESYSCWDYYTLGKLMHYIADSFTFAHNPAFSGNIYNHRIYEHCLQEHFLANLGNLPHDCIPSTYSAWEILIRHQTQYNALPKSPQTDTQYIITVCSIVLQKLISSEIHERKHFPFRRFYGILNPYFLPKGR